VPNDLQPLRELLDQRDLILVTGKGGTGKSTLVAALAELAARRRGRAIAVEVSAHPHLGRMITRGLPIELINLDAEEAIGPALGRLLGLPTMAAAVLSNRVMRLFIRTSPSVREMIVLDELGHIVRQNAAKRCPVIVDLHATGHALSLLDTPQAVRRLLRIGPLAQVARRAEELLLDSSRTELLAVALPEELPVNETIELLRKAEAVRVACRLVVVNQVPSPPIENSDRPLLEVIQRENDGALGRIAGAARAELDAVDLARAQIDRLRGAVKAQLIELPRLLVGDPRSCVKQLVEVLAK
jgi:anion-transporting  ArsA/GET3 family ATPase